MKPNQRNFTKLYAFGNRVFTSIFGGYSLSFTRENGLGACMALPESLLSVFKTNRFLAKKTTFVLNQNTA